MPRYICFIVLIPWNLNHNLSHIHVLLCGNPVGARLMLVYVNFFLSLCRNCDGNDDATARSTRPGIPPYSCVNAGLDHLNWLEGFTRLFPSWVRSSSQNVNYLNREYVEDRDSTSSTITICWYNAGPEYCSLLRDLQVWPPSQMTASHLEDCCLSRE